MEYNITVIPGDGIGPEIVTEAMKVLDKTAAVYGHTIQYEQLLLGGASIDVQGPGRVCQSDTDSQWRYHYGYIPVFGNIHGCGRCRLSPNLYTRAESKEKRSDKTDCH